MLAACSPPTLFACLYRPPGVDHADRTQSTQSGLDPKNSALSAVSRPRSSVSSMSSGEARRSACGAKAAALNAVNPLVAIVREFSPRYEQHRDDLVSVDVSGLERLVGPPRT